MSCAVRAQTVARRVLPAGSTVLLLPLLRDDVAPVLEVFEQLSPRSRELRFLAAKPRLTSTDLRRLTDVDGRDHVALVARSVGGEAIGIARFVRDQDEPHTAEVAVAVVDAWQGQGVGTMMVTTLSERAREVGVTGFSMVLAHDNEAAVRLLHRATGDIRRVGWDRWTTEFALSLAPSTGRRARAVLKRARPC